MIGLVLIALFSFSVTTFLLDKLNFSDNYVIRILQKLMISLILIFLVGFILYQFDLFPKVYCQANEDYSGIVESKEIDDVKSSALDKKDDHYEFKLPKKVVDETVNVITKIATNIAPNIGAAAAAGTIGSTALKLTSGVPPLQRAAAVAGTTFIGAAATTSGIKTGNALIENSFLLDMIKNSEHGNVNKNDLRPPSPDENMILSILENEYDIPLFTLLEGIYIYNLLELGLILLLILLLFNRHVYRFNFKYISDFLDKRFAKNSKYEYLKKFINIGDRYNSKMTNIVIVIMVILLITIKLINTFFIGYLINNIDDFISVYNHLKKN